MSAEAAVSPPDYLRLAKDAYASSSTFFDSGIRGQMEADIRQFNSQHPTGSKYYSDAYKARSKIFRPKTRSVIRKNEAIAAEAFFSGDDIIGCEATNDDDPMQVASAKVNKYLLQHRLTKTIPWFLTVQGAYQETQKVGVCASYEYWDFDKDKGIDAPCVDLIPPENLRIDAAADWRDPIKSSPFVIHLISMYVKDVKAKIERGEWASCSDSELMLAVRAQGDSLRLSRESPRPDSKDQTSAITDFSIVWVHRNLVEIDGVDMVWHTLATEKMLDKPTKADDYPGWVPGHRPFTMGICVLETFLTYPGGIARLTREQQAELNEIINARQTNWLYALNRRYFANRSGQVDTRSLQRNSPGGITLMNDVEKDVKVLDTQDVTSSAFQEQDRANSDFDDLSGSFSQSSVQSSRRLNETVGGMNILTTNANQVAGYQLRTFVETWVEPVLRKLQLLEAHYETDDMILKLAGKEIAPMFEKMDVVPTVDDVIMLECSVSVNVGMGATNPHQKVDNFLSAMKAVKEILADGTLTQYGVSVKDVVTEVFANLGYRSGKRFFEWGNEDPKVTLLQNQVQQLTDALDKKIQPELMQAQIAKLNAEAKTIDAKTLEAVVRAVFASMQSGQMIAASPQIAPIADEVMRIGGYIPPTPVGVDPNFPTGGDATGLTQNAVKDPRTGIEFTPPGVAPPAQTPGAAPMSAGDTSPQTPAKPALPATGATGGINTVRPNG